MKFARTVAFILFSLLILVFFEFESAAGPPATQTPEPQLMSVEDLKGKIGRGKVTVIDVRDAKSYNASNDRIKGSIYVKVRRLAYRLTFAPLKDVPRDSDVVTYCACPHDEASFHAARILLDNGFKRVYVLQGGWDKWRKANGPMEPRSRG